MKLRKLLWVFPAVFVQFIISAPANGEPLADLEKHPISLETGVSVSEKLGSIEKAASTNSVASRAFVSPTTTVYGGFELATSATVYILVRGNSLGTLGVTNMYLDAPRVRLYNSQGQDLIADGTGRAGFNACVASNTTTDLPVINYYQNVRGQATHARDTCLAMTAPAGVYTFSVTPSLVGLTTNGTSSTPSSGEILFEVTLGPGVPLVEGNREKTERLVGGTWTFFYTIISTFSDRYRFTSVAPSTAVPGDYTAAGTDEFGGLVVGTFASRNNQWAVLDPSSIIDLFYLFTFSNLNSVSGCYYQINPPGSTNLSRCYSMSGSRSPPKALGGLPEPLRDERRLIEAEGQPKETNPEVIQAYLDARRTWEKEDTQRKAGKAASARSVASRATVSPTNTVYGGFALASSANVYILVRGNSLGSLGITQGYLDAPRVRIYNSQGQDIVVDGANRPGFNGCAATNTLSAPVVTYYQNVRGAPAHGRDACIANLFAPGAYTFSVTPSIPGSTTGTTSSDPITGEILFEVTLGP
jgi:hypothetical protein